MKLAILKQYYDEHCEWIDGGIVRVETPPRNVQVQVSMTVKALQRKGFLDSDLKVVK